ncbi:hypothetical protein [Streptomyces physcomitrii]|uniref:Transferase n=1 Tax=Streptomyces physcomitrii TaxID=2724184 RepID=A0ABX1H4W6_9ACTN|nr:hypothetical protein [Streptomyces physcomitrii]NKI43404.1 hypothetical protein [Streptomyces physcomitrii]
MTTLLPASPDDRREDAAPQLLHADCVADSAGGLTFDVEDPGTPGTAHLLLRRRAGEDTAETAEEVRLPLSPSAGGRLRAALPSGVSLAEGRWDAFAQVTGEEPLRLTPRLLDLRSLVDRVPGGALGHVAVRIPYATKHGNLTVRSWWRAPHAEAGEVLPTEDRLTVHGRLIGARLTPGGHAELRGRHRDKPVVRARLTGTAGAFTLSVDYARLTEAAGPGVWDLWLLPEGEPGPRARLARLLDDIADRKAVFTYPPTTVRTAGGELTARPYYTVDNNLSLAVDRV